MTNPNNAIMTLDLDALGTVTGGTKPPTVPVMPNYGAPKYSAAWWETYNKTYPPGGPRP